MVTTAGRENAGARSTGATAWTRLVPILFLVPVCAGLALSLSRLFGTSHPVYGWTMAINADAEAMYLGIWPFQDPAHGFTGDAYTPLYPALTSLFDHLWLWTGWPIVMSILSAAGMAAVIAALAYRPPAADGRRGLALLEAAGIGALALSFSFGMLRNAIYEARPDHFCWLLAFGGLLTVPWAARRRWGARMLVVALLSAAFWAKQTALIPIACAVATIGVLGWGRVLSLRAAAVWVGALAVVNLGLLGALDLLTHGWQHRFNFGIALPITRSYSDVFPDFAERTAPAVAFAIVMSALAWTVAGRPRPAVRLERIKAWVSRAGDRDISLLPLAALVVAGGVAGLSLRRYTGGDDNSLILFLWAVAAFGAVAYRRAAAGSAKTAGLAALALVLVFASTFAPGHGKWRLRGGDAVPDVHWVALPRNIGDFARTHLMWDPNLSDLNVAHQRLIYPNSAHIAEALRRDARPKPFERALLGRRFGAVYGYLVEPPDLVGGPGLDGEEAYFWKLNTVLALKYQESSRAPAMPGGAAFLSPTPIPALVPRSGPDPAPWIDKCFGPFRLAGLRMQIHRGGGLWCVPSPDRMVLRDTPAHITEVISSRGVRRVEGRLGVSLAHRAGAAWTIVRDGAWTLRGLVAPGQRGMVVELLDRRARLQSRVLVPRTALHASGGRVDMRIQAGIRPRLALDSAGAAIAVTVARVSERGLLHFWATRNSDAEFNLKELRAE